MAKRKETVLSTTIVVLLSLLSRTSGIYYDHPTETDDPYHYRAPHPVDEFGRRKLSFTSLESRFTDPNYESTIAGIRIKFVWDLIDDAVAFPNQTINTMMDPALCRSSGDPICVSNVEDAGPTCSSAISGCSETCEQDDVVTAEMIEIGKAHASWAGSFLNQNVYVESMTENIYVEQTGRRCYNWGKDSNFHTGGVPSNDGVTNASYLFNHSDTDLVIVMSFHKAQDGVAGYARCDQSNADGRCVVGSFNMCPDQIDVENKDDANVIQRERSTFLHEILHVLGCCEGRYSFGVGGFIDDTGTLANAPWVDDTYDYSAGDTFNKKVRFLTSPKVVATAKAQWNCSDIVGVPMEDVPLGKASHWEARVLGPEVMSYGSGSGEAYISDLTFAYLEDSGHYIARRVYTNSSGGRFGNDQEYLVDYTYAGGGRLYEATGAGWSTGTLSSIAEFFGWTSSMEDGEATPRTPGQLRWGANAGCGFFQGLPKNEWNDMYKCSSNTQAGCTADRRMSARCVIATWDVGTGSQFSQIDKYDSSSAYVNDNPQTPNIPLTMQSFEDPSHGGYNNAMEYVPVQVGYWNCLDTKPLTTASKGVAGNVSIDFSAAFNALSTDLEQFGGQQYGLESRCFESTLREFGSIFTLTLQAYGLCYVANCYREDYLQVGVRGRDGGTEWYRCPKEGGHLYLAGFTGSLSCPPSVEFCRQEDISGVFYTETEVWAAWVIVGVIAGVPVLIFIALCCCRSLRRKVVVATKMCCGLELDPDEKLAHERSAARKQVRQDRRHGIQSGNTVRHLAAIDDQSLAAFRIKVRRAFEKRASLRTRVLFYLNSTWSVISFVMFCMGILTASGWPEGTQNAAPMLISSGIVIMVISHIGCDGIQTGRPSLKLLVYFYVSLFSFIVFAFVCVGFLVFSDYFEDSAESNWLAYRIYAPEDYQDMTLDEAKVQFDDDVGVSFYYVSWGLLGFTTLSTFLGFVSSGFVLTFKNLMQNLFMVFNVVFVLTFGITFTAMTAEIVKIGFFDVKVDILILLMGIMYILTVVVALTGDWLKNHRVLFGYSIFAPTTAICGAALGICTFVEKHVIEDTVNELSDENKALLAEALDLESTEDETLADLVVGIFQLYAVGTFVMLVVMICLAVLSRYIVALHEARKQVLREWARSCRRAEERGQRAPIAPDCSFLNLMRRARSRRLSSSPMAASFDDEDEESKVGAGIDVQLSRVLSNAGFRFHEDNNRDDMPVAAVAIELNGDELPDGFEFPPPPPMSPQGGDDQQGHAYDMSSMRPVPRPPVLPQPQNRSAHDMPVGHVVDDAAVVVLSDPRASVDLNSI